MSVRRQRLVMAHKHRFNHSCEDVFTLGCPLKEDDWLPGWRDRRKIVYSESGGAELGCVFTTEEMPHIMGPATWVNDVYEPFEKIQYSAINDKIVYQIQWDFKPLRNGCELIMTRRWTALRPEAEEFLGRLEASADKQPPDLFALMEHYLATGKMMGC